MQAMVDAGQMTPEQLQMAHEYMSGGFEAFGPVGGGFESYQAGMESYQAGMEAYQAGMEYGQVMEQQYIEQFHPENMNYDNLQQQQFDQYQPPPGDVPGPHKLVQDNAPGQADGWDNGDADNLVDHFHPDGTAPH